MWPPLLLILFYKIAFNIVVSKALSSAFTRIAVIALSIADYLNPHGIFYSVLHSSFIAVEFHLYVSEHISIASSGNCQHSETV